MLDKKLDKEMFKWLVGLLLVALISTFSFTNWNISTAARETSNNDIKTSEAIHQVQRTVDIIGERQESIRKDVEVLKKR